jgi:hypothetical protein
MWPEAKGKKNGSSVRADHRTRIEDLDNQNLAFKYSTKIPSLQATKLAVVHLFLITMNTDSSLGPAVSKSRQ